VQALIPAKYNGLQRSFFISYPSLKLGSLPLRHAAAKLQSMVSPLPGKWPLGPQRSHLCQAGEAPLTAHRCRCTGDHAPHRFCAQTTTQTREEKAISLLSSRLLDPDIHPDLPSNPSASTALALQLPARSRRW